MITRTARRNRWTRAAAPPPRVGPRWTLLVAGLGFAVIQLDVSVVNVAVNPIAASFDGDTAALQWVVDAYTLSLAALILTAGAWGDRAGGKWVFSTGFGLFTAASVACGLAPTMAVLIAARTVQGAGAAVLAACSLLLLKHAYPEPADRARAVGLWAAGGSAALAAGPLVGGVLIASWGWRSIFLINVPVGLIGIWLTGRFVAQTPRAPDRGLDLTGQLAAVAALTALAAAMIEGGPQGFTHPGVLTGFAIAGLAGAGFVAWEARCARPMLPLRLFRSAGFGGSTAIGMLVSVATYGMLFDLSVFFQRELGYSPLAAGVAFAPMMTAVLISNVAAGRLARVASPRRLVGCGAVLMAAACGLLALNPVLRFAGLAALLGVFGLGVGAVVPAITSTVLGSVDASRSGVASGVLNAVRQTGSVIGVALFGSLLGDAEHELPGLRLVLAISLGLSVGIAALSIAIPVPSPARRRLPGGDV